MSMHSLYPVATLPPTQEFLLPYAIVLPVGKDTLIIGHQHILSPAQIAGVAPAVLALVPTDSGWDRPERTGQVSDLLHRSAKHVNAYLRMSSDGTSGRLNNQLQRGRILLLMAKPMTKTLDYNRDRGAPQ